MEKGGVSQEISKKYISRLWAPKRALAIGWEVKE
jgi:hypothetical protein